MPGKNKPKRLDRNRSWRVARRKRRIAKLISGGSRIRKPRPKHKGKIVEAVIETVKKVVKKVSKKVAAHKSVPSKKGTEVLSSSGKKEE